MDLIVIAIKDLVRPTPDSISEIIVFGMEDIGGDRI